MTKEKILEGSISLNSRGIGFMKIIETGEDVSIPNKNLNTALHGDVVKAEYQKNKRGELEGKVTEVLIRNKKGFAGVLEEEAGYFFVVPQDKKVYTDIIIPKEKLLNAVKGDKVFAVIDSWADANKSPRGSIEEVLGKEGDNDVEMKAIALERGFGKDFPESVTAEAQHLYDEGIGEKQLAGRRDFRDTLTFTIDPFDAKDFDDAISFKSLSNGNYEIGVHIADVSHYLTKGSEIDKEAVKRQTSVYLVDRVIPMLPEVLSNDLCSLVEGKDRLTYGAVFEIDDNAKIVNEWFGRTVINSDKRFTYEEAQEVIEKGEGLHDKALITLNNLAKKMLKERFDNGAISLDSEEVKFVLDENAKPIGVYVKERKDAHRMIEEWMLLANKRVATFVAEKSEKEENVFVYRIHALPDEGKMMDLSLFLQNLGYKIQLHDGQVKPAELNALLVSLEGKPEKNIVQTHVTRSMQKAVYSTKNIGHYGLAFKNYTHFTSPIRRYPDVLVHRLLTVYLEGNKLERTKWHEYETLCAYASAREKEAADAERASIKYKQVEYMSDKVGQEFVGVISGLASWGVFVAEKETHCEGLIRLRDLGDDFFEFDEKKYEIVGEKYKEKFTLGQELKIKVAKADLETKTIDYTLVK